MTRRTRRRLRRRDGGNVRRLAAFPALPALLAVASGVVAVTEPSEHGSGGVLATPPIMVTASDLVAVAQAGSELDLSGTILRTSDIPLTPPRADERAAEERQGHADAARGRAAADAIWDRLAGCESNGRWHLDTGNGFYGGLQFALGSWRAVGGSGYPHEHPREVQIRKAERLLDLQGWGAWPSCSRKLGLRG